MKLSCTLFLAASAGSPCSSLYPSLRICSCQDGQSDLAPLSGEDCRGSLIFISPQPRRLFPSRVKYPRDSDPFPAWGGWSTRNHPFWSRRDVDAVFGVRGLHCSVQENGMRFSLCMRIVLALKLDVKQFLVGHEGVTGTEF